VLLGCDVREPGDAGGGFAFRVMDPEDGLLPYDDSLIDVALIVDVLEHVDKPAMLLDEVHRVVRPGGLLLAFVPVEGEPWSWYSLFRLLLGRDLYALTKDHVRAFRHAEVDAMIARHFLVEERRYAYHLVGQLLDATFCAMLRVPVIKQMFWTVSPFHNRATCPKTFAQRCLQRLLVAGNAVAWAESKLLARVRLGSGGVLVAARRLGYE
jgi:SAM-dependent methyltransferase